MREEFMMDLNDDQLIAVVGGKQKGKKNGHGHKSSGGKGSTVAYGNSSVTQIAAATTGAGSTGNASAGNLSSIDQNINNGVTIEVNPFLA